MNYRAFGMELGKFLLQALGRDEKEDIISKWFSNPETAPILNQVAILSDELEQLSTNPLMRQNLETDRYEEPLGFLISDKVGDELRKIYSNI
mmetsp:Transcript_7032/g.5286  ORF Transcript_7032/g.5286 Transcript_7032/m.5286 type:complete len:92 (+) Transcript_7032:1814-2089(+)